MTTATAPKGRRRRDVVQPACEREPRRLGDVASPAASAPGRPLLEERNVLIQAGFTLTYDCAAPTPMLLALDVHPSRRQDLTTPQTLEFDRPLAARRYLDAFGNSCTRILAPEGRTTISTSFEIYDDGEPDEVDLSAAQPSPSEVPDTALIYLLGSRYCDTDLLADFAWRTFGGVEPGWARVQAVCDFAHERIRFDYAAADPTRTAHGAFVEGVGVCRDFAHLAVTLCRCLNIPARYCTGYLGDIGIPPQPYPMDFSAWFEVWLGGRWRTFDARHNTPRIGRILMAAGRDATDVALSTSFGAASLVGFDVFTDEVPAGALRAASGG